jgi:lactam utilization protein B
MAIEIKYNHLGFMDDAAYTFHFYSIVQLYDGQFGRAKNVTVEIREISLAEMQFKREKWLNISDDGLEVTIKFTAQKYYDNKGKVTSTPSPNDVLRDLHDLIKRAVELYTDQYPPDEPK